MGEFLTRAFFEDELDRLTEEYRRENNEADVAVILILRDGPGLKLEGKPTCTDTYILCDVKGKGKGQNARAAIPYGSVTGVTFTVESGGSTMGFNTGHNG